MWQIEWYLYNYICDEKRVFICLFFSMYKLFIRSFIWPSIVKLIDDIRVIDYITVIINTRRTHTPTPVMLIVNILSPAWNKKCLEYAASMRPTNLDSNIRKMWHVALDITKIDQSRIFAWDAYHLNLFLYLETNEAFNPSSANTGSLMIYILKLFY